MADANNERKKEAATPVPQPNVGASPGYSTGAELPLPDPLRRLVKPLVDLVARINATVHVKMFAGFLILALLLLGMGILSLVIISRMSDRVGELTDLQQTVDRSRQGKDLITAQSHFRAMALICELLEPAPTGSSNDCTAPWNDKITSAKEAFADQVDELDRLSPPERDEVIGRVKETNDRFAVASEGALTLYEAGEIEEALNVHIAAEHEISHELENALNGLVRDSSLEMEEATASFRSDRDVLTTVVLVVSGVSLVAALSLGFVLSWSFIRPVRMIDYALARVAGGDFTQRVQVPNRDELGTLSANLNNTSGRLAVLYEELQSLNEDLESRVDEQVSELRREAQQREGIEQELRVARDIQLAFLPKEPPALPGWQVEFYYEPARAVGGDFYDFIDFPENDKYEGIVVGDVSDKGVPAALVMCATRSMLRAAAQGLDSPGAVLGQVNDLLYRDIPPNVFVTCLYAILDKESGTLHFANAGHNLPYLRSESGVIELRATGMPLGLMPGMTYEEKTVTLAPGDSVLFHSDGLTEAHNVQREMFGLPRLRGLMEQHPASVQLIDLLLADLARFTGADWEQEDDVTLVRIRRHAAAEPAKTPASFSARSQAAEASSDERILTDFTLASEPGNEREATERVADAVKDLKLPPDRLERLKTAVAEATMNAMEHGNKYQPDLPTSVRVLVTESTLSVEIRDHGRGEPIPEPGLPDLEAKLAGKQTPRGWGLFLIKNMVDELHITTDETHHTIELAFKLEGEERDRGPL